MILNNIIIAFITLLFSNLNSFICRNFHTREKLKAINLIKKTPVIDRDNSLIMMEEYYNVYYYEDFIMYKLNYTFDSLNNHEHVLQEIRSFFLVFHKDSTNGYVYFIKPDNVLNYNRRVNRDSVLKVHKFESDVYDTLLNFKPDSTYQDKDEVVRVYKDPPPPNSVKQTEKFNLYFYYTKKLKEVPETFSKKMDNIRGMKLCKILIKVSGGYYKEFNTSFPPRELLQEMKEITIENKDEILGYFKKYKTSSL